MANLSVSTEMPQSLDQRKIWFTNLLMLGFDHIAQEDKTKVHFCKFVLRNATSHRIPIRGNEKTSFCLRAVAQCIVHFTCGTSPEFDSQQKLVLNSFEPHVHSIIILVVFLSSSPSSFSPKS